MSEFNGIYTPIVTPFKENEEIDYEAMKHNLDKWGDTNLDGIVVLGSNGEFVFLTMEEKLDVIKFAVNNFNKKKKIIAGTFCESTRETVWLSREAARLGVDAVLVLPPNYYKGGMKEEILYKHFTDVADESHVPLMIYNMPGNTGINISSELLSRLAKHPNIAGVKDTSGNIVQLSETVRDTSSDFAVFAGNASYLLPALNVGARGATLALANIMPDECCELVKLVKEHRQNEALKLQQKLLKINMLVTGKHGVSGLKFALNLLGYKGGIARRPLRPISFEAKNEIEEELKRIGMLK